MLSGAGGSDGDDAARVGSLTGLRMLQKLEDLGERFIGLAEWCL